MKLVYQNTISRLYEKIIGNLSNVHTQDLNDFIYSAQMKGLHQFHIILQSTYMKFSYTRHIPSYTLHQCIGDFNLDVERFDDPEYYLKTVSDQYQLDLGEGGFEIINFGVTLELKYVIN